MKTKHLTFKSQTRRGLAIALTIAAVCDSYNINLLVERDGQGNMVPNHYAIANMARRYY